MAKKDGILGTKLFGNKTVEELNRELYEDFVLVKENIEELMQRGINQMIDPQTTIILLPNLKALLDTSLKNSANMNQLISINTKLRNDKEDSEDDTMASVRKMMKERGAINKDVGIA